MPFPNERACRLRTPAEDAIRTRRVNSDPDVTVNGKHPDVIYQVIRGEGGTHPVRQAVRYPKGKFTESVARNDCKERGGSFEAASGASIMGGKQIIIRSDKIEIGTAIELYTEGAKRFAKFFLLNDKFNANGWRVTAESIPKYIHTAKGMPYVSEPRLEHFGAERMTVDNIIRTQESYRAGDIAEVQFDPKSMEAYAIVEITDDTVWEEMLKGKGFHTSPAIAGFPTILPNGSKVFDEWYFLHLARVDHPAYGVMHASLKRTCEGDELTCMNQLIASASLKIKKIKINGNSFNTQRKTCTASMSGRAEELKGKTTEELLQEIESLDSKVGNLNKEKTELANRLQSTEADLNKQKKENAKATGAEHGCADGQHWDAEKGVCVPDAETANEKKLREQVEKMKADMAAMETEVKTKMATEIADLKVQANIITKEQQTAEIEKLMKYDKPVIASMLEEAKILVAKLEENAKATGVKKVISPVATTATASKKGTVESLEDIRHVLPRNG